MNVYLIFWERNFLRLKIIKEITTGKIDGLNCIQFELQHTKSIQIEIKDKWEIGKIFAINIIGQCLVSLLYKEIKNQKVLISLISNNEQINHKKLQICY